MERRVLQYRDFSKEFIRSTDASDVVLGAVLSQGYLGSDRPVAFDLHTLNDVTAV